MGGHAVQVINGTMSAYHSSSPEKWGCYTLRFYTFDKKKRVLCSVSLDLNENCWNDWCSFGPTYLYYPSLPDAIGYVLHKVDT